MCPTTGQIIGWLLTILFFYAFLWTLVTLVTLGTFVTFGTFVTLVTHMKINVSHKVSCYDIVFPMVLLLCDTCDTLFLSLYKNINI